MSGSRPHNPYNHDEYDHGHDHDSDDSDKEHEEDFSDDEGEHHHDEHDEHHHHHKKIELEDGRTLNFNQYHHDPDHGTKPKHIHQVTVRKKDGTSETLSIWHEGAVHRDVPASNPYAWLYNSKKIIYPEAAPAPVIASASHSSHSKSRESHPAPSAPPASPKSQVSQHYATTFGANNPEGQMRRPLLNHSEEGAENKNDDCCKCTVM